MLRLAQERTHPAFALWLFKPHHILCRHTIQRHTRERIRGMAEKEKISAGSERSTLSITQSGVAVPPAGGNGVLQDGGLSLTILDSGGDEVVQPFPRSPKLLRRLAETGHISQEQLSRRVQELQGEQSKAEDHIQSLKKRKADLSRSTEVMKQQVRERYDAMRSALTRDEQAVLDSLEQDRRETSARLDQVVKTWEQHLGQVSRSISATHRALDSHQEGAPLGDRTTQPALLSAKKPDASEAEIRLNEGRFERLLRTLRSISKQLKAQLQRKTLLLDSSPVVIDRQTCHGQIAVTAEGRGAYFAAPSQAAPERPLQFDKVCCALGSAAVASRQSYWEADVRCCGAWAVGVAYSCLERKGRDKGSKLGRNRNSWCVELRDGRLSAWHNDRNVLCQSHGQAPPGKVGVWVDYQKGQLAFYDAERMKVLQQFSAAMTPVFDRAHHQFTEPLYPALRFLRPPPGGAHAWPNHIQICDLSAL